MSWYAVALKKYAQFGGRSRRSEYWYFFLVNLVIGVALGLLALVVPVLGLILAWGYGLAVLIPGLAVVVRRLHDTGRSGWYYLIGLIPIVGIIIFIVYMAQDSQPGDNAYGPCPK